jgi:hypothetical protein
MPKLSTPRRSAFTGREFALPVQRKEPLESTSLVRNAVARFDQVQGPGDAERDEAWRRIEVPAGRYGVALHQTGWPALLARHAGPSL